MIFFAEIDKFLQFEASYRNLESLFLEFLRSHIMTGLESPDSQNFTILECTHSGCTIELIYIEYLSSNISFVCPLNVKTDSVHIYFKCLRIAYDETTFLLRTKNVYRKLKIYAFSLFQERRSRKVPRNNIYTICILFTMLYLQIKGVDRAVNLNESGFAVWKLLGFYQVCAPYTLCGK